MTVGVKLHMILPLLFLVFLCQPPLSANATDSPGAGPDQWRSAFEALSCQTVRAMEMSTAELNEFVGACDRLRPSIEALDETPRKVYLRKLEKIRKLYLFVLESKQVPPP